MWRSLSTAMVALGLTACSSISHRADVAARADAVDVQELRQTVFALNTIGPRPVSDAEATAATVGYLARRLRALGYEVEERPVELHFNSNAIARVRPADDPEAELRELPVDPTLLAAGTEAMRHQSAILRAAGWEVDGYTFVARKDPLVLRPPNLFATKRGVAAPGEVVEVSAHYDTVPNCPGANDNSSGVAAVMEVARLLADVPLERTLRLCFFGAEEAGIVGSKAHVASLLDDPRETVVALVNLDPVGFAASGRGTQRQVP